MTNAERLIEALGVAFADTETMVDEHLVERMTERLAPISADEIVTVMAGPDDSFTAVYEGVDGMREAWADWLASFAEVRFEIEGGEQLGDNVLTLARQIGVSRHGIEIEQPSAAVWKFRDGMLVRIEFHLDRDRARASAAEPG